MGVTIGYKGNTIATMSAQGTKTLQTAGKYCEDDITVGYVPDGATPSGSINITQNGTVDVTNYASAVVAVPVPTINSKSVTVTVSADATTKTTLTSADADIAAHRADSSFYVGFVPLFAYNSGLSFRGGLNTNHTLSDGSTYGYYMRTNSSGANSFGYITKNAQAAGADIGTTAAGEIFVYASSTLNLRAGNYLVFCGW